MKYKVLRAFFLANDRQEVGAEIEIKDRGLIGTLKSAGKIKQVVDPEKSEPEASGPMTTANSVGLSGGAVRKTNTKG